MKTTMTCLATLVTLTLGLSAVSHAEIYKWIDADGRVHYSERKEGSNKPQSIELKDATHASTASPNTGSSEYWQEQERRFRQRQIEKSAARAGDKAAGSAANPTATPRPKSLSGGREDGSDTSRCNLARDILNGALVHGDGKPIDKYDTETAERDVKTFCH